MSTVFDRFTDLDQQHRANTQAARQWLITTLTLDRVLGDFTCGMVALESYFTPSPEITVEYVHERVGGHLSDDTVRRRLHLMQKKGVLLCSKRGRTRFYRLRPDIADAAIAQLKGEPRPKPQVAVKSP